MDGGIRSGQHVLKARALGAKGTYIGRSFVYGLGAMGEAGVTKALEIIHKELDLTMAFCGHTDINDVGREVLLPGPIYADTRRTGANAEPLFAASRQSANWADTADQVATGSSGLATASR
jgi:hypothetical protein